MSSFLKKQTLLSEDKTIRGQKELTFDRCHKASLSRTWETSVWEGYSHKKKQVQEKQKKALPLDFFLKSTAKRSKISIPKPDPVPPPTEWFLKKKNLVVCQVRPQGL